MKVIKFLDCKRSNMKCIKCGGWGGEYGDCLIGLSVCYDCYWKFYS